MLIQELLKPWHLQVANWGFKGGCVSIMSAQVFAYIASINVYMC